MKEDSAAVVLTGVGSPSFATLLLFEEVTDVLWGHHLVQKTDGIISWIRNSQKFGFFMIVTIRNAKCTPVKWAWYVMNNTSARVQIVPSILTALVSRRHRETLTSDKTHKCLQFMRNQNEDCRKNANFFHLLCTKWHNDAQTFIYG